MMDSQEKALEQEQNVEQNVVETAAPAPEAEVTETPEAEVAAPEEAPVAEPERKQYQNKKEVLARAREIAQGEEAPQKEEVDYLKTAFYKLHIAEREARLKEYIDGGGDPEAYQILPDEDEEAFKAEMGIIKERRQKLFKEQEQEKQENLQRKLEIIEKIKAMVTSPEEANKSYKEFKALQEEWKEIKNVPAEKANELWRNYQLYVEQFYDLLKLNSEAREYDFKKNLELKTKLCEAAEKLAEETEIISAFHQLQKLHQEFREIGPVAKELREEIWTRFKAASTVINKRHQQHFEELRAKEEDNLARKTALCEKVEAIAAEENKGSADWERNLRAFPCSLRRLLRTQSRVFQGTQGEFQGECRQEACPHRESQGLAGFYRLEIDQRQTHQPAERVEDHRYGTQEVGRPAVGRVPWSLQQVLRGPQCSRSIRPWRGIPEPGEETWHHRTTEGHCH